MSGHCSTVGLAGGSRSGIGMYLCNGLLGACSQDRTSDRATAASSTSTEATVSTKRGNMNLSSLDTTSVSGSATSALTPYGSYDEPELTFYGLFAGIFVPDEVLRGAVLDEILALLRASAAAKMPNRDLAESADEVGALSVTCSASLLALLCVRDNHHRTLKRKMIGEGLHTRACVH